MKTYIFKVINSSPKRGCNRTLVVYRVKNNTPEFVGDDDMINTASYIGDYATACRIIAKEEGLKMSASGYALSSKVVRVLPV